MSNPEHKLCGSRAKNAKFEQMTGYRDWFTLCDFGFSEATAGRYNAFVNRVNKVGGQENPHYHEHDCPCMYILKGWVKVWCEEEGEFILEEEDFVYHPSRHVHDLTEYTEDFEILQESAPGICPSVDVRHYD